MPSRLRVFDGRGEEEDYTLPKASWRARPLTLRGQGMPLCLTLLSQNETIEYRHLRTQFRC